MRLLIDECLPRKVKFLFAEAGLACETVREAGSSRKENGELLALADKESDVFVTIDRNIPFQQNLDGKKKAILIICTASSALDDIRPHVPQAIAARKPIKPRQIVEVGKVS